MKRSTAVLENFGLFADGSQGQWTPYLPTTSPPWPGCLIVHGGGFRSREHAPGMMAKVGVDMAAAGYFAAANNYRLAPPGKIFGQTTDGRYPQQHADMTVAILAMRADPRCNGSVVGIGGSAGGSHVCYAAGVGTAWQSRLDAAIPMSGAYDYSDRTTNVNLTSFVSDVENYVNSTDLTVLLNASPISLVDAAITPCFYVNSTLDTMPFSQLGDVVEQMEDLSVTNFIQQTITGRIHAFALWPYVKDQAIAFLNQYV